MSDAPMSAVFALPLRLGRGTITEAPIFDRHGDLVGDCVGDDCDERALAFIRAVNSGDELVASGKSTSEMAAKLLLRERGEAESLLATTIDDLMACNKALAAAAALDRLRVLEINRLRAALHFYANPEIYKPHPHGLTFDSRDMSFHAVAALGERS